MPLHVPVFKYASYELQLDQDTNARINIRSARTSELLAVLRHAEWQFQQNRNQKLKKPPRFNSTSYKSKPIKLVVKYDNR